LRLSPDLLRQDVKKNIAEYRIVLVLSPPQLRVYPIDFGEYDMESDEIGASNKRTWAEFRLITYSRGCVSVPTEHIAALVCGRYPKGQSTTKELLTHPVLKICVLSASNLLVH